MSPRADDTFHPDFLDEAPAPERSDARYIQGRLLGRGGMGEVHVVHDTVLRRDVARKTLLSPLADQGGARARFLREAQATAQLQHPAIVPVHDAGFDGDGRPWFTMRLVEGRTLGEVVAAVHDSPDRTTGDGWSVRRLVAAWRTICEAVAYAHARGVLHRDLKPDNVVVGRHGEVLVLDWGLVHLGGGEVQTDAPHHTRVGAVSGTPAWMAPEQARGEALDARTDVHALGLLLFHCLSGRAPRASDSAADALAEARAGAMPALPPELGAPAALVALCRAALSPAPADRPADAGVLAQRVGAWLDGLKSREAADALVEEAAETLPRAAGLRAEGARLADEAAEALAALPGWAPPADKAAAWSQEDAAQAALARGDALEQDALRALHAALSHVPGHERAHAAMVSLHRDLHDRAVADRDPLAVQRARGSVAHHVAALPTDHAARIAGEAWLRAEGELRVSSSPGGGLVQVEQVRLRDGLPVREAVAGPATCPVHRRLPAGVYQVRFPGHGGVVVPVRVAAEAPTDLHVTLPTTPEPSACFVAAGPVVLGGDPDAADGLDRQTVDLPAFWMRRFPITHGEYIAFLDDLLARGDTDAVRSFMPQIGAEAGPDKSTPVYGTADGRHIIEPDPNGNRMGEDWPVFLVDLASARAYAAWFAERTGQPWRLPTELEWEKAARGVDERLHPFGGRFDPVFCNMRHSRPSPLPQPVDSFPLDVSPYGVRGLAGNMRDWCEGSDERPVVRGGCWSSDARQVRAAYRFVAQPWYRHMSTGFRLARDA